MNAMRSTLALTVMTILVVGSLAGPAIAQPGGQGGAHGQGGDMGNATAREARLAELHAARNASLASFHENRTAALEAYHAAHNATKASFMENKTRVQDECRALRNSTEGGNQSEGQCVRDGLKPLIAKARAEHKEQHDALIEALRAARTNAIAQFAAARGQINARHQDA